MNLKNVILIFGLALFFTACKPSDNKIKIGYVQITQDPVLDAAKAGLFRALTDSGFVNGQNIKVIDNNAQGDLALITTILQSFQSQNVKLIVTNSTPCMVAAAQTIREIPVVFTVAFGPEQLGINNIPKNIYGVYDPLNVEKFVDVMKECIPNLKRIGIAYNNSEQNAEYSVKVLNKEFTKRGIVLVTASVTSTNDIPQATQSLIDQKIDALVAAADNTIYLALPVLAKLASENKIPLFVTDPLQAKKGASVGYGINYDQWGYQSGLKAVAILKGRASMAHRIEPLLSSDLIINQKACVEQGLQIPKSVRDKATQIL